MTAEPIAPIIWTYDPESRTGLCVRQDEDGEQLIAYFAHRVGDRPAVANEMVVAHRAIGRPHGQTAFMGWCGATSPSCETPSLWVLAEPYQPAEGHRLKPANDIVDQRSAVAA